MHHIAPKASPFIPRLVPQECRKRKYCPRHIHHPEYSTEPKYPGLPVGHIQNRFPHTTRAGSPLASHFPYCGYLRRTDLADTPAPVRPVFSRIGHGSNRTPVYVAGFERGVRPTARRRRQHAQRRELPPRPHGLETGGQVRRMNPRPVFERVGKGTQD